MAGPPVILDTTIVHEAGPRLATIACDDVLNEVTRKAAFVACVVRAWTPLTPRHAREDIWGMVDDRIPGRQERKTRTVTCRCGKKVTTSVRTSCPQCGQPVG